MTPRDPLERWMAERKNPRVPEGFSHRVMGAVRAAVALRRSVGRHDRRSMSLAVSTLSALVAAGCAISVLAWHLALVGALVLAAAGTAY
jgi:hypothetical protein